LELRNLLGVGEKMKTLHEQLKKLEEKAEKIGLMKDERLGRGWIMPYTPEKELIELGTRYDARIKKLMEIGAEKNIRPEYLERWAEDKYNKIDWDEQTMLLFKEQTNLYYEITALEKKIKGEEDEKDNLRQT
tara:strand:+ start:675 stop:1070 length:396 start_codon:yes stop_codon:yes gene_type:complete